MRTPSFHLDGLVVLDEVQRMPKLFSALRVLVDRPGSRTRFLVLGSASPDLVRGVSETLAGRVELIEMSGFGLDETGAPQWRDLWVRGGFPRSYLAASDDDSRAWRDSFVSTFLERDVPQLGISIPAAAMRRFWTMLAHSHGQTWHPRSTCATRACFIPCWVFRTTRRCFRIRVSELPGRGS
ncbi:MAG: AAA family ATPase [Spirochaetaceae bacterium]|nr:AAA family ATPase [Spirochaetaceae bacterium]